MNHRRLLTLLCLAATAFPFAASACDPWPAGVTVRKAAGKPLAYKADFNGDSVPDTLEIVSIAANTKLPPGTAVSNPWDSDPAKLGKKGAPTALAITHGTKDSNACQRYLLVNDNYLGSPIWEAYFTGESKDAPLAIVTTSSRKHKTWKRSVRALKGDAAELGTEAGIDILLYWNGKGYKVFWPEEEP